MEARKNQYFICNGCFLGLTEFVLKHPKLVKVLDLPTEIKIRPMPHELAETCERCEDKKATGYLGLAISEQVVV